MHSISRHVLLLVLGLCSFGVQAQPLNCKAQAAKLSTEAGKAVRCFCGNELDNLRLTLPKGLKVAAACGLADARGAAIDLDSQKLSLDAGDKKTYPSGTIYLSGSVALEGVVTVNPSEAGDMWFESAPQTSGSEFVRKHLASNIRLGSAEDYRAFKAPKPEVLTPVCFNAPASISASELEVRLAPKGGKSRAVAKRVEVNKVARFKKCDPSSLPLVAP